MQLRAAGCGLRAVSYELRATSYELTLTANGVLLLPTSYFPPSKATEFAECQKLRPGYDALGNSMFLLPRRSPLSPVLEVCGEFGA